MTQTIYRTIPAPKMVDYTNLGWTAFRTEQDNVGVAKRIETGLAYHTHQYDCDSFSVEYASLQEATIIRPLGQNLDRGLANSLTFFYEDGKGQTRDMLLNSLFRIEAQWSLYSICTEDRVSTNLNGRILPIRIYGNFDTPAQLDLYVDSLITLGLSPANQDFWWDTKNDIFFSFDNQYMLRIDSYLRATFQELHTRSGV